jgi:hypothetical protein
MCTKCALYYALKGEKIEEVMNNGGNITNFI